VLQGKARALTNLLLGNNRNILRARRENKVSYLGTVKTCLAMRSVEGVNVKVEVVLAE
jgi:hypothetical protein